MAEFLPNINPATNLTAYSQINTLPNQSELLLNFLNEAEKEIDNPTSTQITTASLENLGTTPINLSELIFDINSVLSPAPALPISTLPPTLPNEIDDSQYSFTPPPSQISPLTPTLPTPNPTPEINNSITRNIIPPNNTALFEAYTTGGRAWYEENNNVVVKWPDKEIFRSFDKTTGQEIDWLKDRLSYEPLDTPDALSNYINNYHGEIVAETKTWAFVKFPSGGFIKISKPTLSAIPFLTQK